MASHQLYGADGTACGQPLYESRATNPAHPLGFEATDGFGNYYRYCKAGAADLVVGNVIQSSAQLTNHHDCAVQTAAAVGDRQILVTLGATAATENFYAGGTATVSTTPGLGQTFRISGHAAVASAGIMTINLFDEVRVALTTSSQITLAPNPYSGVIQAPASTPTGAVVGCAVYIITAAEFGWIGSGGVHGTLIGATPAVGTLMVYPGNTAGEVVIDPADAAVIPVGILLATSEDAEVNPVLWYRR